VDIGIPARRRLQIHDHEALRILLEQIDRPDEITVEDLAGLGINERHFERLLDADDLRRAIDIREEHAEHVSTEREQA
jgi:hypothetical protein